MKSTVVLVEHKYAKYSKIKWNIIENIHIPILKKERGLGQQIEFTTFLYRFMYAINNAIVYNSQHTSKQINSSVFKITGTEKIVEKLCFISTVV